MLADRTLLSMTLAVTFASGTFVGYMVRGQGVVPKTADAIYAKPLDELRAKGYDDAEMSDARKAYTEYLAGYQYWWNQYLDAYPSTFDGIDKKLESRLADLAKRHEETSRGR